MPATYDRRQIKITQLGYLHPSGDAELLGFAVDFDQS